MQTFDPHGTKRALNNEILKAQKLGHGNAKLLLDFVGNYRHKKNELSPARKLRLLLSLRQFAEWINKPMRPFGVKEAERLAQEIKKHEAKRGRAYSLHSWREIRKNLRVWIKYANPDYHKVLESPIFSDNGEFAVADPYGRENNARRKTRIDEFLITEPDFLKMLNAATLPMDKALLAVGFGCGPRLGEVLGMRWKDVRFNEDKSAFVDFIESKTTARPDVLLMPALAGYLSEWSNQSPDKNPDAFVFVSVNGKIRPLSAVQVQSILHHLSVRIGWGKWKHWENAKGTRCKAYEGKRVYWTMFRRAHATWALRKFKNIALASKRVWGNESSQMTRVYSGLVADDVNEAYQEAAGLATRKAEQSKIAMRTCFKCGGSFLPTFSTCPKCNIAIDPAIVASAMEKNALQQAQLAELTERMKAMELFFAQKTKA